MNIVLYLIGIVYHISCIESQPNVKFNIPTQLEPAVPYTLTIEQSGAQDQFPPSNFLFSFEIYDKAADKSFGTIPLTDRDFKNDNSRSFSIKNCTFKHNLIEMQIIFGNLAYGKTFLIRYGVEALEDDKQKFFDDRTRGVIYQLFVNLLQKYNITMNAKPDTGVVTADDLLAEKNFQLLPEKDGLITCQATDALPQVLPQFTNSHILHGPSIKEVSKDMTSLQWQVRLEDHGKVISCKAGNELNNITLNVYHYVSYVTTSPPILNKVSRNSQLKCISPDGYPHPKMKWIFTSGPHEAYKYYQFRDNDVTLLIHQTAPINSNWTFECRGHNEMPLVVTKYLKATHPNYPIIKSYNFTITDSDETVKSSKSGIVVMLVIFLLAIVICVVVSVKYRSEISSCLKGKKESEKPAKVPECYKYQEIKKDAPRNGAEEVQYSNIIGTVEKKDLGPIHVV